MADQNRPCWTTEEKSHITGQAGQTAQAVSEVSGCHAVAVCQLYESEKKARQCPSGTPPRQEDGGGATSKQAKSRFSKEKTLALPTPTTLLRYYLVHEANTLCQQNLDYKAYSWHKYQESRKHRRKHAFVFTPRKPVTLAHTLPVESNPYPMPQAALKHQQKEAAIAAVCTPQQMGRTVNSIVTHSRPR